MSTFTRLLLRVRAETGHGEVVKVSGSGFALGHYREAEAIELVTTPDVYPIWFTPRPLLVPRGVLHRYKYALYSGGQFVEWENTDSRERQVLPRGQWMTVQEAYGECPVGAPLRQALEGANVFQRQLTFEADEAEPVHRNSSAGAGHIGPAAYPPDTPLLLVSYQLPVEIVRVDDAWHAEWDMNSLIARLDSADPDAAMRITWVGTVTPRMAGVDAFSAEDRAEIEALLREMRCAPIFVDPALFEAYYLGYCKQVIWPLFHNVDVLDVQHDAEDPATADGQQNEEWWAAYREVNDLIARQVLQERERAGPEAVLWVHDYHLLLVPQRVAALAPGAKPDTVLFLHVPFPTSEIFRSLPTGDQLLSGLLASDVVGFHAFDHARHFLNTAKRLKGLSYQSRPGGTMGVEYNGRNISIAITHVGIKPLELSFELMEPAVRNAARELRSRHERRFVLAGADVCQRLAGVALKLLAFERLLQDYPVWRDRVVLVQRCWLPGNRPRDERRSRDEIRELVARINARFPGVVDYGEVGARPPSRRERLALWRAADVLLLTSVREGLNLYPLEFVYAHAESPAVVVASEFSASCRFLNGALQVSPWNIAAVAAAVDTALMMPRVERQERHKRDLSFVNMRTCSHWSRQVLADLRRAAFENRKAHQHLTDMEHADAVEGSHTLSAGDDSDFAHLQVDAVAAAYRTAESRVVILDYGGTLIARERIDQYVKKDFGGVTGRRPTPRVLAALQALVADPRNLVVVVSGVGRRHISSSLGSVSGLALAPSSGFYFSGPNSTTSTSAAEVQRQAGNGNGSASSGRDEDDGARVWEPLGPTFEHDEVLAIAKGVLDTYTARTNGSEARYLDNRIAWNYRSCDPEWGHMQAAQLQLELESKLANYPVRVMRQKGQVEILPEGLHKGIIVKHALDTIVRERGAAPDFVLCVGDDSADEVMFTTLYRLMTESSGKSSAGSHQNLVELAAALDATPASEAFDANVFTCIVGKKPSHARFYINGEQDVEELLVALSSAD